jgi:hypothetical protein
MNIEFIECLLIITTNHYNTVSNLHSLQITTAVNSSHFVTDHCLVVAFDSGDFFYCFCAQWFLSLAS